jgi:hypothetical protein
MVARVAPGPKPEAKAYRIQLDLSASAIIERKSLNRVKHQKAGRKESSPYRPGAQNGASTNTSAMTTKGMDPPTNQ